MGGARERSPVTVVGGPAHVGVRSHGHASRAEGGWSAGEASGAKRVRVLRVGHGRRREVRRRGGGAGPRHRAPRADARLRRCPRRADGRGGRRGPGRWRTRRRRDSHVAREPRAGAPRRAGSPRRRVDARAEEPDGRALGRLHRAAWRASAPSTNCSRCSPGPSLASTTSPACCWTWTVTSTRCGFVDRAVSQGFIQRSCRESLPGGDRRRAGRRPVRRCLFAPVTIPCSGLRFAIRRRIVTTHRRHPPSAPVRNSVGDVEQRVSAARRPSRTGLKIRATRLDRIRPRHTTLQFAVLVACRRQPRNPAVPALNCRFPDQSGSRRQAVVWAPAERIRKCCAGACTRRWWRRPSCWASVRPLSAPPRTACWR